MLRTGLFAIPSLCVKAGLALALLVTGQTVFMPPAAAATLSAPMITTNPSNQAVNAGTSVSFTAAAAGNPTPTVRWQRSVGGSFSNITGATSRTYTFTAAAGDNGNRYRAVFTNSAGTATTAAATLTVTVNQAPAFTSGATAAFTVGTAGSFTVTTTGTPTPAITRTGTLPAGLTFVDNGNGTATLSGTPTAGGTFPLSLTASNGVNPNATQTLTVTVNRTPAITSANSVGFTVGTPGSFTVTTSGYPAPAIGRTGALPAGMTFVDNGNGTATLSGTPTGGGSFPLSLTASNGVNPNATQTLTVTVTQAPAFTSGATAGFTVGTAGSFTVTTTGTPTPAITRTGTLPAGLTFVDNGNGTATLAGTPSTGGSYSLSLTASNGVNPNATQTLSITVSQAPAFTSAASTSFAVGTAGSFTVTTSGFPNPTLTTTGTLPAWLGFTDNGDGTATLAGTPSTGSGGTYGFTIHADNGQSPSDSQAFTLTVNESPTITSADHATFQAGTAGSFLVTTAAGFPVATTVSMTGTLPSGVTFTPNGSGGATIAGTPAAGATGSYPIIITAANGASAPATQSFTLTVVESPVITSADHAPFTVGTAGSFSVTTSGEAGTTVSYTGTLPSGVSFTPSGNGAVIAGTPAAGTGGTYPITITASDGVTPNTTQNFTLTVNQPPTITSADHDSFTLGVAGFFTVTTAPGVPTTTTITRTGTLPAGVSFTDNGDGTATIAGTPTAGGSFPITITASNGVAPNDTQTFTLTVNQAPSITSADHTTFEVGTAGTFSVTTSPAADTVTRTGTLPSGVSFTDNGDGTATLAGTPAAGTGGVYTLTLRAANATGVTTQSFTLTVHELPVITSGNATTSAIGSRAASR